MCLTGIPVESAEEYLTVLSYDKVLYESDRCWLVADYDVSVPRIASIGASNKPVLYYAKASDLDCKIADDVQVAFER